VPTLNANGADLYYVEHGSAGAPIVFGHGTLISSAIWQNLYFPLLPPEWHAYALDFRGHGRSCTAERGCTFAQMAEDVRSLALQLGLGRFVYVGLSMGGGVGLQLALRYPELLRGMVLVSSVTGLGPLGNPAFRLLGPLMAGRKRLLRMALSAASTRRPSREDLETVVDEAAVVTKATLREYLARNNRIEGIERLASLPVPTLVLIGARDSVIPAAQQERLAEILPNCRKVVFADEGHAAAAESPARVLAEIRSFVDALPRDL
jgi:3-oxoadipate enol-lactonase